MGAKPFRAEIARECASPELAEALRRSLAPENAGFASATVSGSRLVIRAEATSLGELRRTVDDLLACIGTAEKVWAKASPTRGGSRTSRTPTP